jgi:hypothetical protein
VRHPNFPKSICGVVYEGSGRASGCQFTFTCDGALAREIDMAAFAAARRIAERALNGYVAPAVGAATYYHADYVFPAWAPTLVKLTSIGPHIFYRMAGEAGRSSYLTGRYQGHELKLPPEILLAIDSVTQRGEFGPGHAPAAKADAAVLAAAAPAPTPVVEAPRIEVVQAAQPAAPLLSSPPTTVIAAPAIPAVAEPAPRRPRSYFGDRGFPGLAPDPFRR